MKCQLLRDARLGLAAAVAALLLTLLPTTASYGQTQVRMVQAIDAVDFLPIYIAREKGFFTEAGLELTLSVTGASGPDVAALIAEEVDFAATSPQPMFNAAAHGRELLGIFNLASHTSIQVLINDQTAEEIGFNQDWDIDRRVEALKGMKIGVTRPGALTDSLARHYIDAAGYEVGSDVQIVAVGGGPGMLAALEQNQVNFIMGYSPIAEQHIVTGKSQIYIDVSKGEDPEIAELLGQVLVIRADLVEENPQLIQRVVDVLLRANKWIKNASDDEVAEVISQYFQNLHPDALRMTAAHQREVTPEDGKITKAGVETAREMHVMAGGVREIPSFEELFTNEFVE